jgi:hypothetical protein
MTIGGNEIKINVSPKTGEYVAWLYPERYNIQPIAGFTDNVQTLDLSDAALSDERSLKSSAHTYTDSTYVPPSSTQPGHWRYSEVSDTVRFNAEWSHYHLEPPSYSVKQLKGAEPLNYFGLDKFEIDSETEIALVTNPDSDTPGYVAGLPVFLSYEPYRFELSAYEYYENGDIKDKVPVADGVASFSGTLLNTNEPMEVVLDSLGKGVFEFYAGEINLGDGKVDLTTSVRVDGYSNSEGAILEIDGQTIGSYEVLVALNGVNNVRKVLPVQLKVSGSRPDRKVNPNDFESSMNITGQIKVEGTYQEDPDDMLAAFIGDLCVGVASPVYVRWQ